MIVANGGLTIKRTGIVYYAWGECVALEWTVLRAAVSKILRWRGHCWHHQDINIFESMVVAVLVASVWSAHQGKS